MCDDNVPSLNGFALPPSPGKLSFRETQLCGCLHSLNQPRRNHEVNLKVYPVKLEVRSDLQKAICGCGPKYFWVRLSLSLSETHLYPRLGAHSSSLCGYKRKTNTDHPVAYAPTRKRYSVSKWIEDNVVWVVNRRPRGAKPHLLTCICYDNRRVGLKRVPLLHGFTVLSLSLSRSDLAVGLGSRGEKCHRTLAVNPPTRRPRRERRTV